MRLISGIYHSAPRDVSLGSVSGGIVAPGAHTQGEMRGEGLNNKMLAWRCPRWVFWVTAAANLGNWNFILVFEC